MYLDKIIDEVKEMVDNRGINLIDPMFLRDCTGELIQLATVLASRQGSPTIKSLQRALVKISACALMTADMIERRIEE